MKKDANGFFPIKILFLGSSNVGKTSLITRLINREDYKLDIIHNYTTDLDIYLKGIQVEGQLIKCELYDTPGIIGAINDNLSYIKLVNIIIFVFDLSSKNSFDDMKLYYQKYKDYCNKYNLKKDAVIIGNKLDKKNREVNFDEINNFTIDNNLEFYYTSAKDDKSGYNILLNFLKTIVKNFLIEHKILIKDNYFDEIRYKYISKRNENTIKPSLIYKQIDIFIKNLTTLFPNEEYTIDIIKNINEFYKNHIFKKFSIINIDELKKIIFNLENIKCKLIDIYRIVVLKYNMNLLIQEKIKKNKNDTKENNSANNILNEQKILTEIVNANILLKQSIHYCIHDYIINFIFEFNNKILLYNRYNMIIKEDTEEDSFIYKYFCNIEYNKTKILRLFNDNFVKYLSKTELHQYYFFIRNIDYLFNYLNKLLQENDSFSYFEKGINALNILQEKIKESNNSTTKDIVEINKDIMYYSKKSLKYFKYILEDYDIKLKKDDKNMDNILNSIKIRLYLAQFYYILDKKYETNFYFYSAFLLIGKYIKENKETLNDNSKDIFDLYNKIKEMIYKNEFNTINIFEEKSFKEMKKKIKYILNNSIDFSLLYNQEKHELKLEKQFKAGINLKNISNNKYLDFLYFPEIILKTFKSFDENKLKFKIKLYEIYAESFRYFKRLQFNMFFICLSKPFYKKESLISYDGKDISSLKIDIAKIEKILSQNYFLPIDIAQLFNLIGISLMLLFRKNEANDKNLFKKNKEKVLKYFNAGLNESLIQKSKELDINIKNKLNINETENNFLFSLEQIRICIKYNIYLITLTKDKNKAYDILQLFENFIYDNNDFPLNYLLSKGKELYNILYLNEDYIIKDDNKSYLDKNIFNIFPNINNYLPCYNLNEKDYLVYYIDINNNDEFDLINTLILNNDRIQKFDLITQQNFKANFSNAYNNAAREEKYLFNNILSKENLSNIDYWKKKFDNKQGNGFLFNPIYFNYLSKYYNFKINIFIKENEALKYIKSISEKKDESGQYIMNIICDKKIAQSYQIFIPLIPKNEILNLNLENNNNTNNINDANNNTIINYINNLNKRAEEFIDINPNFTNFLLWTIMNIIKLYLKNEKNFDEINEDIINILVETMFKLGLYEQIIDFVTNNIDKFLKNNKNYYIMLFYSYKRLCLYDNCISVVKKYLYMNTSLEKKLDYDTILKINSLKEKDFSYIYNEYKNLEKKRPIEFIPPLIDEDLLKILYEKTKDDNIFNLDGLIAEDKIKIYENTRKKIEKEKLKDGNKYRILCIEGGGIRTLIQILFLCEIENYIKKPISQAFDCIVTSKDGIILCGLLTAQNEKGEIKYHANDILKIFNNQKETIYNPKLGKALKLELFKKLFDISEVIGNLFYFDEKTEGMLKIGSNDLISDLFANFIDNYKTNDDLIKNIKEVKISLNHILRIIPINVQKENIYLMNIGNGVYKFNNEINDEEFMLKKILKERYFKLDIDINTCKDDGKYSLQNLDNNFNELLANCIEYFEEIKDDKSLYNKLGKFFNITSTEENTNSE